MRSDSSADFSNDEGRGEKKIDAPAEDSPASEDEIGGREQTGGVQEESDVYEQRWKSRICVAMQCRQHKRPLGCAGYHARIKGVRRHVAAERLGTFLDLFVPTLAGEAESLLTATRRWPRTDVEYVGPRSAWAVADHASRLGLSWFAAFEAQTYANVSRAR